MTARYALRLDLHAPVKPAARHEALERDSDEALVRQARTGDFTAFETLFERHRLLVYRFAYQMTNRRDDAEDLVQEVFVRAYQNLHRYRDEAKFTTWLLRIATNLGTDRARMSQRRMALETQEAGGALTWMTVGETDDPVENLEQERRVLAVREALAALPDYKEIGAILGCTVGGAKLRVLRARRALRDRVLAVSGEWAVDETAPTEDEGAEA
jgi:RNA polymerase sigma-70 factor, ECF subfamily